MRHPNEAELALYAGGDSGGDMGWLARQRVEFHLRSCGQCQQDVTEFSAERASIQHAVPDVEVNWKVLSAEMKANIRLGLEAGSCVDPIHCVVGLPRAGFGCLWRQPQQSFSLPVAVTG